MNAFERRAHRSALRQQVTNLTDHVMRLDEQAEQVDADTVDGARILHRRAVAQQSLAEALTRYASLHRADSDIAALAHLAAQSFGDQAAEYLARLDDRAVIDAQVAGGAL